MKKREIKNFFSVVVVVVAVELKERDLKVKTWETLLCIISLPSFLSLFIFWVSNNEISLGHGECMKKC